MATPPYNFDTANPATTTDVSAFPANEQAFRGTVASAIGTVVDPTTGFGPIVTLYTTTQKNALVNPPTGLLVYDTTLSHLYINTGTPASPTWTQC
jgi:hypothetical protein